MPIIQRNKTEACQSGMHRYGMLIPGVLEDYLEGKKVIVVGPAGYLVGKGMQEYIDSFEVVVRVNHAMPVINTQDYGTRTDLLYHILSRRVEGGKGKATVTREEIAKWKECGLKYLITRHDQYSKRIRQLKYNLMLLDWESVGEGFYRQLKRKIGSMNPNTGLLAVMHLFTFQVESVNVIGFDFYRSGVYKGYGDIKEHEDAEEVNRRWHDTNAQLKFLKQVAKEEKRLIFDEVLEGIINEVED
jgi:hypothetical protein